MRSYLLAGLAAVVALMPVPAQALDHYDNDDDDFVAGAVIGGVIGTIIGYGAGGHYPRYGYALPR